MTAADVLLAVLAVGVSVVLSWRARPLARVLLFGSALVVGALLFLPTPQLVDWLGQENLGLLGRLAALTPWELADWIHFVVFVWLGLLMWLGRPDLRGWKAGSLLVVLSVAAEFAQGLTSDREPRLEDVLLNLAGVMVGLFLGSAIALRGRPRAQ